MVEKKTEPESEFDYSNIHFMVRNTNLKGTLMF